MAANKERRFDILTASNRTTMNPKRVSKYLAIMRTQVMNGAAYPLDLATRSITMVLFMWIFAHLWDATFRAMGQTAIAGLTLRETMWYLMLAETIVLSKPRLSQSIAEAVKEGGTVLGTARCAAFRTREGRLQAAKNLLERGIDRAPVTGPAAEPRRQAS